MAEEFQEKTEQATGRRRQKEREQGHIPQSKDLTGVMPLWVVFVYFSFGGFMFTMLVAYLRSALKRGFEVSLTETSFVEIFRADSMKTLMMMAPLFASLLIGSMAVHFLQTGFLISTKQLSQGFSKINPLQGIKRFFSLRIIFEGMK